MMGVAASEVEMQADEAPLRANPLSCGAVPRVGRGLGDGMSGRDS